MKQGQSMNTQNALANFSWFVFFLFVVFAYGGLHLQPHSVNLLKSFSLILVTALNIPLIIKILSSLFNKIYSSYLEMVWLAIRLIVAVFLFKDVSI
jgi:hypothetical protein